MALSKNPLSPVSYHVAKGVRKNFAVIQYVIEPGDDKLSLQRQKYVFERKVWLYNVSKANEYLVASGVYKNEDLVAIIPALCLLETRGSLNTDPVIKYGQTQNTLESLRPWDNLTGGIKANIDQLVWNGMTYRIIKIEAMEFWNNDPAKFKLTLRSA